MSFAQSLKSLRIKKGITQKQFAEAFNISSGTIGNWESGTREPCLNILCALADYFGVTTDQLLGRAPLPKAPPRKVKVRKVNMLRKR